MPRFVIERQGDDTLGAVRRVDPSGEDIVDRLLEDVVVCRTRRWHSRPSERPLLKGDNDLDRRISTRVEDLSPDDVFDDAHTRLNACCQCCWCCQCRR